MRLAERNGENGEPGDDDRILYSDLCCGITPRHIRRLCDIEWEGGHKYTPQQVGDMTLDMIFMLLVDRRNLRSSPNRVDQRMAPLRAINTLCDKDGLATGRTATGEIIRLPIKGMSKARRLREAAAAARQQQPSPLPPKRPQIAPAKPAPPAVKTPQQRRRERAERRAERARRKAEQ